VLNAGFDPDELTSFFFFEHGLDLPEDGLYALESFVSRDPEACGAFVDASVKGWMFAFTYPDSALRIVTHAMLREHVPTNLAHQTWMLNRMKDVMIPEGDPDLIGRLDEPVFRQAAGTLVNGGVIRAVPAFKAFYRWRGGHVQE
jgi:NitT/TauT family transport system substrate-binding protein